VLISRLARDQKYRGQGICEMLLVDTLGRSLRSTSSVGAIAEVVEAENETARKFNLDFGFIQFPDNPDKLIMSMETLKSLRERGRTLGSAGPDESARMMDEPRWKCLS
jgi:hypothetical protein